VRVRTDAAQDILEHYSGECLKCSGSSDEPDEVIVNESDARD
jgi:hypothetical protein